MNFLKMSHHSISEHYLSLWDHCLVQHCPIELSVMKVATESEKVKLLVAQLLCQLFVTPAVRTSRFHCWGHESVSPPVSFVHGISQARIREWVTISFFRGSFRPRDRTQVSWIASEFFTVWATPWGSPLPTCSYGAPKMLLVQLKNWISYFI